MSLARITGTRFRLSIWLASVRSRISSPARPLLSVFNGWGDDANPGADSNTVALGRIDGPTLGGSVILVPEPSSLALLAFAWERSLSFAADSTSDSDFKKRRPTRLRFFLWLHRFALGSPFLCQLLPVAMPVVKHPFFSSTTRMTRHTFPGMVAVNSTMLPLGTRIPEFRLPDSTSAKQLSLAEFKAAPAVVVMFLCNHCPYVKHVQGGIVQLARDYTPRGVKFVGISSNDVVKYPADSPEKMAEEARSAGYVFPYLYDERRT